jgi:5'/3'-nucleotidase
MTTLRRPLRAAAIAAAALCVLASTGSRAEQSGTTPYRILLANDDGVRAPGLLAVAEALKGVGEITISAPNDNQSGKGHSITISDPIFVDRVTLPGGLEAFAVTATPATCVKVGVAALSANRPDLVVSGINRGYNLGMVAYVSGTVGAAREAALMGIPSVAASLSSQETDYKAAAGVVRQVVEMLRKNGLERGAFLNVNVPPGPASSIKGIQLTRQSLLSGTERFEEQKAPNGRRYFWSVWNEPTGDPEGTDVWAVEHGFAAVTPMRIGEFDPETYEAWRVRTVKER